MLEKFTTLKYIDEHLDTESRVADIGAGTGIYIFEIAGKVKSIAAVDLVQKHVDEICRKANEKKVGNIEAFCGSAIDFRILRDEEYDIVLCLGPMYHLRRSEERLRCLNECKRIVKKGGILFVAYINKLVEMNYFVKNGKFMHEELINEIENGEIKNQKGFDEFLDISYLTYPEEIEKEAQLCNLKIVKNLGTDGISYLLQEEIEKMNSEEWDAYIRMHQRHCEDKSSFGMSMHGLLICRK